LAKARAKADDKRLLDWLCGLGEQRVARLAREVLSRPQVARPLKRAVEQAARVKSRADRNIGAALSFLNLPTKQDHEDLRKRLEAVQGSLTNLSIKLDRLLGERKRERRGTPGRARR
jgi:hypothetical protein